ncbi:MAG TPA: ATP synthase subunit A [Persephonella sp.]|uniref:V-type ATP synthase alpha chain n=1 Tax=Persephonella marina (strain DSM 14350 / EX-H1) TaxID=123214 RepID=C0QT21_PERMH|nr:MULTISPECIES: V-type ATP synthase subunit A [Persephonella]ACO03982.1 V-type ATP synthase alpha chain (V-type ATPase subunitA) [Persephonella marina EX-H1]HCB70545.1 ATP synthase subunit A [Persephonella sp.]
MARISYISGSVVKAKLEGERPSLLEMVYVGKDKLIGEVISVSEDEAVVQVYENTEGISLGEDITFSGEMLSAVLSPGLLGKAFDGIQRPLNRLGRKIKKGERYFPVDRDKRWRFFPSVKEGEYIFYGQEIGYVEEGSFIHRILSTGEGRAVYVAGEGDYTVEDTVVKLENGTEIKMLREHPLRVPLRFKKRLKPDIPMITGQRIIDFLFPIAKGGTASIPGGFGTGKTVLQQTLAKWSDADLIVYIGCGERGNEMTEVLNEFPQLEDPYTGKKLIERTVLIANTSDMPVSAREASIYLGITIAEYFRDMGYHVALMADSTSRWAEAIRELSARINEIPAEEGFPADLASKIASVYERAGYVEAFSGKKGSITVIGAVSPPGGDFSEPVTRHTRRFTTVFWALDKELASSRFYPAINYMLSYSGYVDTVRRWWEERSPEWFDLREWMIKILQEDDKLQRIVKLLGSESLPEDKRLVVEIAYLIKEIFLQQNAFDPVDAHSSPEKQIKIAEILRLVHDLWIKAFEEKKIPVKILKDQPEIQEFLRSKYEVGNDRIEEYDRLMERIKERYHHLILSYGE